MSDRNLDVVLRYLGAIEDGEPFENVSRFLTEDVIQREFPNQLVPNGATRGLQDLAEAAERGRKVVTKQRYEVLSSVSEGGRVALEVRWTATLAVPFGSIPAGGDMTARFGVFFVLRDGRIASQHNYDCFDPW